MLELLNKEDAEDILQSFKQPGADWIEADGQHNQSDTKIIKKGDRREITGIANALIRQRIKIENPGKKFHESDKRILTSVENILFSE